MREEALDSVLGEIAEAASLIHGLVAGEVRGYRVIDSLKRLAGILGRDD